MASLSLSGLASGFDWKTLVDNLMDLEAAPITRMQAEQTKNTQKAAALDALNTRLGDLKTASDALNSATLFGGRTASPTDSTSLWQATAGTNTATGNYTFDIQQLATTARRVGVADIASGLSATDDVSGTTLATLPTATAVKAGTFTVNGQAITIALTDSLKDVFDKISAATGGTVTASYSAASDKVTLASTSEIILGASNDTSNFLAVTRLANNGTGTVESNTTLGATNTLVPFANARLRSPITAVDPSGNGSITVNGVAISYNINTESLSGILAKITNSAAGVSASYDSSNDRVVLTNKTTGDVGLSVSEAAGGLADALGLTTSTLERGKNALFTLNGGATLTSTTNTLDASVHGIEGLSVSARTQDSETISVASNTTAMRTAVETFVAKYNAVQSYIDDQTKITSTNGKVTTALLSDNREIQSWAQTLRSAAFGAVAGLSGTVKRLEDLGIDFNSSSSQLAIKDSSKLDAALSDHATDVQSFFTQASTGFAARFNTLFTSTIGTSGTGGSLGSQKTNLTKANTSIDAQIATIQRQLDAKRAQLEAGFIAMENAQSKLTQMQQQLQNAFGTKSSS